MTRIARLTAAVVRDAVNADAPAAAAPVTRPVSKVSQVNKAAAARALATANAHDRTTPKGKAAKKKAAAKAAPKGRAAKAGRTPSPFAGMSRSERMHADPRFAGKVKEWRAARRARLNARLVLGRDAELIMEFGDAKAFKVLLAAATRAKADAGKAAKKAAKAAASS